jgi:hypothetical protein
MSKYAGDDDEDNWAVEEVDGNFEDGEDVDDDGEIVHPSGCLAFSNPSLLFQPIFD